MATSNPNDIRISSGLTLTSDFYMNKFYSANRNAYKTSKRGDYTKNELSYEDSRALRQAARQLGSYTYRDDDNLEGVRNTVKAFVDTYNNTIDSTSGSNDAQVKRFSKQLKALAEKYGDDLKNIGISVEKNGSLSINEGVLELSDMKKIRTAFSKENGFMEATTKLARKLKSDTYDALYVDMTGNGGRINISL